MAANTQPDPIDGSDVAIEDFAKKAGDLAGKHKDKIGEALSSDQAEQVSDKLLDGAANLANKVTGGKHSDKIDGVRDDLDGKIGNE